MSQKIYTNLDIKGNTTIGSIPNATTDTDKFLVSDNGLVKYRTGAEMLSDLGVDVGAPASNIQHQVKAAVAINKGQAVYVSSADGTNMIVSLASNATEATSSKTMGLLADTVAINGFSNVVAEGLLAGLNTSTAVAGDPVWLGTGGNLIYGLTNKPYAPAHLVFIGIVTRVNANNGEIFVKVQNGFELDELHDVDLKTTTPVNGHILGHNGTLWVNKTIAAWLGYTPANANGTLNKVAKFTSTGTTLGDSQIFDNGTNVGIGTTSPGAKLDVNGNIYAGASDQIQITPTDNASLYYHAADGTTFTIGTKTYTNPILFAVNSLEKMRIASSGNVGIGTTTPGERLVVSGNTAITGRMHVGGSTAFGNPIVFGVTGQSYLNGNVGIGTTSPAGLLHLKSDFSSGVAVIYDRTQNSNVDSLFYTGVSTNGATTSDFMWMGTSTSDMTITGAGNVGIGTTSPGYKLDVNGSINVSSGSTIRWGSGDADIYNIGYDLIFRTWTGSALTEKLRITSAGNIGIGTTSPNNKLDVRRGTSGIVAEFHSTQGVADEYVDIKLISGNTNAGTYGTILRHQRVGTGGGDFAVLTNQTLTSTPVERMRIASNGAIKFNTYGSGSFTGTATQKLAVDSSGNVIEIPIGGGPVDGSGTTNYVTKWADADTIGNSVMFDNGTNVGIGTTSPGAKLNIAGPIGSTVGSGGSSIKMTNTDTGNFASISAGIVGISNGGMEFSIEGNRAAVINYLGNVGIGTTSPGAKLEVNSSATSPALILTSDGGNEQFKIRRYSNNNEQLILGFHSSDYAQIQAVEQGVGYRTLALNPNGGNVGIGTASPATKLDVLGSIKYANKAYYDVTTAVGNSGNVKWTLQDSNGTDVTTSSTNKVYRVQITTLGTGTNTGEVWIAQNIDAAGWSVKRVHSSVLTPSSNFPYMVVDTDGLPKVTSIHAGTYNTSISVEEYNGGVNGTTWGVFGLDSVISAVGSNVGIGTTNPGYKLDVNGIGYSSDSFRAPIFYDSNNTGYYIDPSSQSNLNTVYANSFVKYGGTSAQILAADGSVITAGTNITISGGIISSTDTNTIYTHPSYTTRSINTSGAQVLDVFTSDAIGSVTNITTRTMTLADLGYTGATNANYYVLPFTDNSANWNTAYSWGNHAGLYASSSHTHTFDSLTAKTGGTGTYQTSGDFRAPIFYDSNNTGYYLNPDSTSNLNALNLAGDLSFGSQTGTWITSSGMSDSIGWNSSYGVYIGSNTLGYSSYIRGNGTFTNNTGTHNLLHADNYTTYTDPRLYRGYSTSGNFQTLQSTAGTVRFDQIGATGSWSNAPGGYAYGGALSLRGDNFGMQLWGSHTGDFYFKTQWNDDQYSGWRQVLHSANYTSFAAAASHTHTFDSLTSKSSGTGTYQTNGDFRAPIFYDSDNTGYYLNPASTSNVSVLNAVNTSVRRYYQTADGVPTSNLGSPSVTEMALFDSQFNNKTEFLDPAYLKFYTSTDGTAWSEYTGFNDATKRDFVGGDNGSGITIPNLTPYFAVEVSAVSYVFLNALYMYWSSNSHNTSVKVQKRRVDNATWYDHTTNGTLVSAWPGHLYLPFGSIPFLPGPSTSTGHFDKVRFVFQPNWASGTYASYPINLTKFQVWGGYPAGKRNIYATDSLQNVTFPASLRATDFIDSNNSAYYLDPSAMSNLYNITANSFIKSGGTSAQFLMGDGTVSTNPGWLTSINSTMVTTALGYTPWHAGNDGSGSGLDADLLDGNHASAFALASHTHAYDNYQYWNLKTNGVQRTTITSNGNLDLVAGTNVSLSYGAGGVVTISSTDTNTVYTHPAYTARSIDTSGAQVIDIFTSDAIGSVTNITTRTLTPADIGAAAASHTHTFDSLTSKTSGTGTYQTSGDFRAPIFYDSDNTGYYVNPAYISNFNTVLGASIQVQSTNPVLILQDQNGSGASQTGYVSYVNLSGVETGWVGFGSNGDTDFTVNNTLGRVLLSGTYAEAAGDFRAPIFYDSNNTAYYVDPASTSNLLGLTVTNTITGNISGNANYATSAGSANQIDGIAFRNGNSTNSINPDSITENGIGYVNSVSLFGQTDGALYSQAYSSVWNHQIFGDYRTGQLAVRGRNSGTLTAWRTILDSSNFTGYAASTSHTHTFDSLTSKGSGTGTYTTSGDFRAPIFYDSNNTGYYLDPSSTTQINNLRLSTLDSAITWTNSTYMMGSPTHGFRFNDNASSINALIIDNSGNSIAYASHRAPIFYDTNNTGYYLNPASTSNLNTGNLAGRFTYSDYLVSNNSGGLMGDYNINSTADKVIWTIGQSWPLATMYGLGYSYGSGYGHHLALKNNGTTYHRISFANEGAYFTGTVTAGSDFRAPIFYDSNNTVFYLDPANTTTSANLQSKVVIQGGSNSSTTMVQVVNSYGSPSLSSYYGALYSSNAFYVGNPAGTLYDAYGQNARFSLYYDRDNTSYYVDPASTSVLNRLSISFNDATYQSGINVTNTNTGAQAVAGVNMFSGAYSGSINMFSSGYLDILNQNTTNGAIQFRPRSTVSMNIDNVSSTSRVTIGSSNTASHPLRVTQQVSNVSIYADYDIVAYSDQSVKENIRPIENVLDRVNKSRGVLYDRIDSGEKNNIGFIAQELEVEFPELVVTNEDNTKAVKYQNAVAVLFEAVKEQQKQIEELKELVNKLITK